MKIYKLLFMFVIIIACGNLAVAQEAETLTGVVRITTDETGTGVTAMEFMVMTEYTDESGELNSFVTEYRIVVNDLARELQELDGAMVEVTGQISGDENVGYQIEIETYSVVEEESDDNLIDEP